MFSFSMDVVYKVAVSIYVASKVAVSKVAFPRWLCPTLLSPKVLTPWRLKTCIWTDSLRLDSLTLYDLRD